MTTASSIVLATSTGDLILTTDPNGWCQVELVVSGVRRPLGANLLTDVSTRLRSFLMEPKSQPGLHWILSLAERHSSAYGEHVAGTAVIHLQDADAKWIAKIVLASAEASDWIAKLAQYTEG